MSLETLMFRYYLKETYCHHFILGYYLNQFFWTVQCSSSVSPLCPRCPLLAPVSVRPPSRYPVRCEWPAHTHLSQHHSECLRSALLFFQLPASFTSTVIIENVSHGDVVMSRIHGIKGWTTEEALQGPCSRVILDFRLFSFQDLLLAQEPL